MSTLLLGQNNDTDQCIGKRRTDGAVARADELARREIHIHMYVLS